MSGRASPPTRPTSRTRPTSLPSKRPYEVSTHFNSDMPRDLAITASVESYQTNMHLTSILCRVFGCEENDSLVLNDFLTGVGQLKFRGTSLRLRAEQSAFAALKVRVLLILHTPVKVCPRYMIRWGYGYSGSVPSQRTYSRNQGPRF